VLFAAAIAMIVLKEPLQRPRIIAAGMIVAGLVLIRLGQETLCAGGIAGRLIGQEPTKSVDTRQ